MRELVMRVRGLVMLAAVLRGEAGPEGGDWVELGDVVAEQDGAGGHTGYHYGDVEFDDAGVG